MRLLSSLITVLLLSASLPAHAAKRGAVKRSAGPKVTAKARSNARPDATSALGSTRLTVVRTARTRETATPSDKRPGAVITKQLVARWKRQRSVEVGKHRAIKRLFDKDLTAKESAGIRPLLGPVESLRRAGLDNATHIGFEAGKERVIYSSTYHGNELRIVTFDTATGRPLETSKNLAGPVLKTALQAAKAYAGLRPDNVVLGWVAEDARAVEVKIHASERGGTTRLTYRVGLTPRGEANGGASVLNMVSEGDPSPILTGQRPPAR
jgi:hypothetical protein